MNTDGFIKRIAAICHEANKAYCANVLDDHSQPSWNDAPDWQKDSAIKGVQRIIKCLDNDEEILPSDSHDAWLEEKRQAGWKYGDVKDPDKKEHPCFVSYEELPEEQRMKDYLFCAVAVTLIKGVQE